VSFVALGADDRTTATVFNAESLINFPQEPQNMIKETVTDESELNRLKAEIEALKTENAQFKAEATMAKKATREIEIKNLFSALGRDYTDELAAPYFTFSSEQFSAVSKDLLAQMEKQIQTPSQKNNPLPNFLFSTQAGNGAEPPREQSINLSAIYSHMNAIGKQS
jgi:predicted nuclease with TOPRIM domain